MLKRVEACHDRPRCSRIHAPKDSLSVCPICILHKWLAVLGLTIKKYILSAMLSLIGNASLLKEDIQYALGRYKRRKTFFTLHSTGHGSHEEERTHLVFTSLLMGVLFFSCLGYENLVSIRSLRYVPHANTTAYMCPFRLYFILGAYKLLRSNSSGVCPSAKGLQLCERGPCSSAVEVWLVPST